MNRWFEEFTLPKIVLMATLITAAYILDAVTRIASMIGWGLNALFGSRTPVAAPGNTGIPVADAVMFPVEAIATLCPNGDNRHSTSDIDLSGEKMTKSGYSLGFFNSGSIVSPSAPPLAQMGADPLVTTATTFSK